MRETRVTTIALIYSINKSLFISSSCSLKGKQSLAVSVLSDSGIISS